MSKLLLLLFLIGFFNSANIQADEIDDMLAGGENTEFDFQAFGETNVMAAIAHDAAIVCIKGLCTLSAVDTKYGEFSVKVNGGIGNNASGGFGGYGSGDSGTNTNISFNNYDNSSLSFSDRLHVGLNIQYKSGRCTREVKVPRALYYSINKYLYGMMNEDGSLRRTFNPADEAVMLFYTTVMKQASGCR